MPHANHSYWQRKRRLTVQLLTIWFVTTFCTIYFARELDHLTLFGWPLSFYMAAQGVALIYLALVAFYTWRMQRIDADYQAATADNKEKHSDAR